jgi:hypothetical protein
MFVTNKMATVFYHRDSRPNLTGWPVKVTVTGQSAIVPLAIGEALAYQHMSIMALEEKTTPTTAELPWVARR